MRFFVFLLLTTLSTSASAQIGAGRWLLAGNGFGSDNRSSSEPAEGVTASREGSRNWSGTLSIRVGYFTNANWAIGLIATQNNSGDWYQLFDPTIPGIYQLNSSNGWQQSSIGLFSRHYRWLGTKRRFALFAEAALSYSYAQRHSFYQFNDVFVMPPYLRTSQSSSDTRGAVLSGAIGAVYRINRWLGLEVLANLGSLRYNVVETNNFDDFGPFGTQSSFQRNTEFQASFSPGVSTSALTVGFQFYLGRGQGAE